jgi:hypothetical protein
MVEPSEGEPVHTVSLLEGITKLLGE